MANLEGNDPLQRPSSPLPAYLQHQAKALKGLRAESKTKLSHHSRYEDTVDRFASQLLDSPTLSHPNGLASHPSQLDLTRPVASDSSSNYEVNEEENMNPEPLPNVTKRPPTIPLKSSRRFPRRQGLPKSASHMGAIQPQGQLAGETTQTGHTESPAAAIARWANGVQTDMPKPTGPLTTSNTMPLTGTQTDQPFRGVEEDYVDLHKKIRDMLAATDALKPHKGQKSSRVSRITQKVSEKVIHAMGIFQRKPKKARPQISAPLDVRGTTFVAAHAQELGPGSPPQPAADDDARATPKNKATATHQPHTPVPAEHQIQQETPLSPVAPELPCLSFQDHNDLDDDLDAILEDLPQAASTPRLGPTRTVLLDDTPSKEPRRGLVNSRRALLLVEDSEASVSTGSLSQPDTGSVRIGQAIPVLLHRPLVATKKHPSPSKSALDDLAEQVKHWNYADPTDSADEIAAPTLTPPPTRGTLTPKDKNILMGKGLMKSESKRSESVTSASKTKIPRPVGSTRSEMRFGVPKHPVGPAAMEADELA